MSCSDVTGLRAAIKGSSDGSRCDNLDWRRRKRTTVISFQCLFFAAARQQTKSNVCSVNARAASKHRHGAFTAKKNKRMPLDAPCQPKSFHPPLACQTTLAVTSQWPPCQKYLLSSHNSLSSFLRYKAPLDSWGSANWTMRDGSGFNSLFIARRVFIRFFL